MHFTHANCLLSSLFGDKHDSGPGGYLPFIHMGPDHWHRQTDAILTCLSRVDKGTTRKLDYRLIINSPCGRQEWRDRGGWVSRNRGSRQEWRDGGGWAGMERGRRLSFKKPWRQAGMKGMRRLKMTVTFAAASAHQLVGTTPAGSCAVLLDAFRTSRTVEWVTGRSLCDAVVSAVALWG